MLLCPFKAIRWNYESESPDIDNGACIGCGLCAARCPVDAVYISGDRVEVSRVSDQCYTSRVACDEAGIERQREQLSIIRSYCLEAPLPERNRAGHGGYL